MRSVTRALKDKLIPNGLVSADSGLPTKGRPALLYRINPHTSLDAVAESFGVLDWHQRTAERHERERGGYREVQRLREQRELERFDTMWRAAQAKDDWLQSLPGWMLEPRGSDVPKPDPFVDAPVQSTGVLGSV